MFQSTLRERWATVLKKPSKKVGIDESMHSYYAQGPQSDTSPQRFIPRKPHPNGLLTYVEAVKLFNGPFILDIEVDRFKHNKLNPRSALISFTQRWPESYKLHTVVDAAFSEEDVTLVLNDMKSLYTGSVNRKHKEWLYDLLLHYCKVNHWIAVRDLEGRI